jgi:hypothetical protein
MVASVNGGKGSVWLKDLKFSELPPPREANAEPGLYTEKGAAGLDFRHDREFGGVKICWRPEGAAAPALPARAFVELSDSPAFKGALWRAGAKVEGPLLDCSYVSLPEASARLLRVRTLDSAGRPAAPPFLLKVLDLDFSATPNAAAKTVAGDYRRGVFPKAMLGREQSNWTVLGVSGDEAELLFNEEGQVELRKGGPSLEPFVRVNGRLLTWADGKNTPGLLEGYLPVGTVRREFTGETLELSVTALAEGTPGASAGWVRYRLKNLNKKTLTAELVLAVRPFQVLPPWQFLNMSGGTAQLGAVRYSDGLLDADGQGVRLLPAPRAFLAAPRARGDLAALLDKGLWPEAGAASCPEKSASGAGVWKFSLKPGEQADVVAAWPLGKAPLRPLAATDSREAGELFEAVQRSAGAWWRAQLGRLQLRLPPSQKALFDTARSQLAYIHINRDGAGIQPGSRSYERSWVRDGAMTSLALLEFGQTEVARSFVEWYAAYQFPSGKVPCVVDRRGPDPVPEHDSHGQLIFAIANVYRFTGDLAFLEKNYSHIERAVDYIKNIRAERMTPEFSGDGFRTEQGRAPVPLRAFYGLVPESISHEGYSAKPMHSYWDDFFILRGLKDAAAMAAALGRKDQAADWAALRDDFRATLLASLAAAGKAHGIDYLPGCAELGDFDAASSAVALTPCGELPYLPREAVKATFDKYWAYFERRRDDREFKWVDYTPYELRIVGAMVMLGQKERASEMLDWFMADRLPAGFNHWAEIVHRDRSKPAWIGDMPHTWVGSDFLRSLRTLFLYEDEGAGALHVLAGVPAAWLTEGAPIGFTGLGTPYGGLSAEASGVPGGVAVTLSGELRLAELGGGLLVHNPAGAAKKVLVDGGQVDSDGRTALVKRLPAKVEFLEQ